MKKVIFVLTMVFMMSCGGTKPTADWTAHDFYKAAKEKFDDESYFESANDFQVVLLRFSGSIIADSAQYYLAYSHFNMGDYLIAGVEFEKLVNDMNQSPLVPLAQFKLAESYDKLSPRSALDQEYTLKAIKEYQYFVDENPTDSLKEEAEKNIIRLRSKLGEKELENAEIYRKMKEFKAAIIYYDQVLTKFYDTEWADDAQFGKIITYKENEELEQAQLEIEKFEQQFPDSPLMAEIKDLKKELTEQQEELAKDEKK